MKRIGAWVTGEVFHLVTLVLICITGCTMVQTSPYTGGADPAKTLSIWALSDIHPRTREERHLFEEAIADANTLGRVDIGIMAGDLLRSRSDRETFDWFMETRNRSRVPHWFEIAGNHDARSQPLFSRYFQRPSYYGVAVGNILILMLSDESVASETDISDKAFYWWKEMVMGNQDKVIITVTHAQLENSGLLGSAISSRVVAGSARFEEVLRQAKVTLWLSGHSHLPHSFAHTVRLRREFNNTCFVNVSSISRDAFLDSQSRMLVFQKGDSTVWIRSRNHTEQRYESGLNVQLPLDMPFVWDGAEPVMILP